jgi:CubicO group peptidase (beta-lactamase class C family)
VGLARPDFRRAVKLVTPLAAREGWEERHTVTYDISPNETVTQVAYARRSGANWTVVVLDGSDATVEKRGAAANLLVASLRPAGYVRETFAGAPPARSTRPASTASRRSSGRRCGTWGSRASDSRSSTAGASVYEGGLGVRELGRPAPVDAHTQFMIASNTKGMSTLLLARLVDEGKLRWDQPVTQVYPAFRLGSDATTRSVQVKHLVCACTGLPRKDYEWLFNTTRTTPASTTFAQLAATQPTSGFGEVFQYNNLMASAAGYIGAHLVYPDRELGAAYDAAMQRMIFAPLGMRETTFDMRRALAGNHASPHALDVDGRPTVARMDGNYTVVPYRPAGGAWSSAHDLVKYVQLELAEGKLPDGRQLVSAKNLLVRRAAGVPEGEDAAYGMGLSEEHGTGVSVVHHGGSLFGYKSDWLALPRRRGRRGAADQRRRGGAAARALQAAAAGARLRRPPRSSRQRRRLGREPAGVARRRAREAGAAGGARGGGRARRALHQPRPRPQSTCGARAPTSCSTSACGGAASRRAQTRTAPSRS